MPAQDSNTFVLEVARQGSVLSMSIFERNELASTLKHYSQLHVVIPQINKSCQEVTSILDNANKNGPLKTDLLDRLKKTGRFLWDHLLTRQVKDRLVSGVIKELVLSLDEELIDIPWELLYDGNEFFCLKYNLGRVVRTKEQPRCLRYRSAASSLRMLILANPTDDLQSAYQEGVYIKNQFERKRNKIKIDFKSTHIDTLYVKKNLRDYDIVHFAGHCEYDSADPKSTGWLLSDGKFTTGDIFALSESLSLPNLVFSNACLSAKNARGVMDSDYQEKTYSLAAAFLFSGVRHYIGTIWQIEDPVSLVFAKEFYDQLIKGSSVGAAIRSGRLRLIKEYGSASISWANYILYGDPHFVLFRPVKSNPAGFKIKERFLAYRRHILKCALCVFFICVVTWMFLLLPVKNPNTYFLFLESKRLFEKGKNPEVLSISQSIVKKEPLFLEVYPLLSRTYERLGDRNNSLKYYFEYALYSQKRHDNKNLASSYIGIGQVYQAIGDYPKAFEFYNKAVILSKEQRDKLHEAVALRKLAVWYTDKEDYNKALELLMKALEINQDRQHVPAHRYNLACDYFDIGLVFADKDDYAAAKEFYQKSKLLFEKMKLKNELNDYYFNLGELYSFERQYHTALDYYFKGLRIDELHGNKPSIAVDYDMIAELYMEMGNFEEAEKLFTKALSLCREIKAQPELASVYYNLGTLYKRKGQKSKAKEYFRLAQELYYKIDTPVYQRIKQEFVELNK
jgi:CHAT domain-containing protein/tetratricopeptide (TPR) repeat protein